MLILWGQKGPKEHEGHFLALCFSQIHACKSCVEVARARSVRHKTSHVYIKPYLFTNYVQMIFLRNFKSSI